MERPGFASFVSTSFDGVLPFELIRAYELLTTDRLPSAG